MQRSAGLFAGRARSHKEKLWERGGWERALPAKRPARTTHQPATILNRPSTGSFASSLNSGSVARTSHCEVWAAKGV
ncbi:hypothetical protein AHFPHNDE_03958 [Pseudomonas sp. MM227]|nr:hypothetical protein AHFPHNDE_03958 [Pseudomonas sp. MM227]